MKLKFNVRCEMGNVKDMNKGELVVVVEDMEKCLCEMEEVLIWLELKLNIKSIVIEKEGRKEELIKLLKEKGKMSIEEIGKMMKIEGKNVSSIMSGIRKMKYVNKKGVEVFYLIGTDSKGRKFFEEE